MKKTNPKETAIEAAQKLIQTQIQKDCEDCTKELEALEAQSLAILKKYNCSKNIQGQFINNQIKTNFVITKNQ
jgi:hypothetical protein